MGMPMKASITSLADISRSATSGEVTTTAPPGAREESRATNWSRELIKEIAADIGTDMVAYIEVMYPEAIAATSSTFKTSVRNHIYNQVMAAIEITDADQIAAWLKDRKKHRREWLKTYREIRRKRYSHPVSNGDGT
jgi:hypothetical protein